MFLLNRVKDLLLLNLHLYPCIYLVFTRRKDRMECIKKKFNIFGKKKKSELSTKSQRSDETDMSRELDVDLIDGAPVAQDPVSENDVIETKQVKTSEKKLNRQVASSKLDNYWTVKHESQKEKQKEQSLNIAWCGARSGERPGCQWSWREKGGLFGGGSNGVGKMRRYWQSS